MRLVLVGLLSFWLTGCAYLDRQALDLSVFHWQTRDEILDGLERWSAVGRVSFAGSAMRFHWQQAGSDSELTLMDPLGRALLTGWVKDGAVRLRSLDGKVWTGSSVDEMLEKTLGYPVPLHQFPAWLLAKGVIDGKLADGARETVVVDGQWTLSYGGFVKVNGLAMPQTISVTSPDGAQLKLLVRAWELDSDV